MKLLSEKIQEQLDIAEHLNIRAKFGEWYMRVYREWLGEAQKLESEIEELKCKLDEYIEQERAKMERPQSRNLVPKGMVLLSEEEYKRLKALDRR